MAARSTPPSGPGVTTATFAPAACHASRRVGIDGVGRDHQRGREIGVEERAGRRHPAAGVEQDAQRRRTDGPVDVAHRERGPIGERGAGADDDGLRLGAQSMDVGAGFRTGDPPRGAVGCGRPPVDADRPTSRTASARPVLRWCRYGRSEAAASSDPMPTSTVMPAARSRSMPVPATRSSGSSSATTTRATPAAISASAQGGVRPWWEHGSSVVYAVAPRARAPAAARACDLGVRGPGTLVEAVPATTAVGVDHDAADPGVRRRGCGDRGRRCGSRAP